MRKMIAPLASILATSLIVPVGHTSAKGIQGLESVPNELVVKLKQSEGLVQAKSMLSQMGVDVKEQISDFEGGLYLVRTDGISSLFEAQKTLAADPRIEYVEPNFIYRAIESSTPVQDMLRGTISEYSTAAAPTDPQFNLLWGMYNDGQNEPNERGQRGNTPGVAGADIDALAAWDIERGDRSVKIAVIDTGINYNHQDLKNNVWTNETEARGKQGVDDDGNGYVDDIHGYDFVNSDGDPMDDHSHGTHVSGTIAGEHNNGVGVAGVMAEASLVGVKFLSAGGSGSLADAVKGIDYATKIGVDIMSNSWGGGGYSQALEDAIKRAKEAGIVFVAAAGNSGTNNDSSPHYPSSYNVDNVVAVAASDARESLASFSCYGARSVHVAAPGHNILSSVASGGYEVYSGTSMATPHVSGAIGLLIAKEGRMDVKEVRQRVMETSEYVSSYRRKLVSHGRLNAYNLLTNTRPERQMPKDSDWITMNLPEAFESAHPYAANSKVTKTFSVPGARYIRVVVKKYDLEARYDNITVRAGGSRTDVEKVSGAGENYFTDYVEGDTVDLEFTSDYSVHKWGFVIDQIQYIPASNLALK